MLIAVDFAYEIRDGDIVREWTFVLFFVVFFVLFDCNRVFQMPNADAQYKIKFIQFA